MSTTILSFIKMVDHLPALGVVINMLHMALAMSTEKWTCIVLMKLITIPMNFSETECHKMNNKIDRRRHYIIILDTETVGTIQQPLWFDIGFVVVDTRGNMYEAHSYINYDIYINEPELMDQCYYYHKLPQYEEEINAGIRIMSNTFGVRGKLYELIKKYEIKEVCAHNMPFDYRAMNNTIAHVTNGKQRYYLPREIEYWDTLRMARDVIIPRKSYEKFCRKHGLITEKTKKPKTTAEALYAYISDDPNFVEDHTGLEDALIEKEILKYCFKQHKKMNKKAFREGK